MLSFDISDKKIQVVKGELAGGKIKIAGAMTIDVPDGVIINGFVQELSKLVTIVSERLRDNRFMDKEAVVTLSSSQVVFRELKTPKAKGNALYSMIKSQIHNEMGISDEYNITYTIVGEEKENNASVYKILAAACPNEVVIGITRLFNMLSIPIRNISINCNSISRIILSDPKNKDRMPLLAVQIDENFLNLNLYENNQLAFSRVVPISKEDYGTDDYMYQALNENVFRMIQFNRARGGSRGIKDVIFYGDVSDYIKLTRAIEQQDVKTHILAVPSAITGYERFEFALFANAIGAMLKGKKETERTNLLEIESTKAREQVTAGFYKSLIATFVLCGLLVGGVTAFFKIQDANVTKEKDEIVEYNESGTVAGHLAELAKQEAMLATVKNYVDGLDSATAALLSNKTLDQQLMNDIRATMKKEDKTLGKIIQASYKQGKIVLKIESEDKDYPAMIAKNIDDSDKFYAIAYNGLERIVEGAEVVYESEITIALKEGSAE